MAARTPTQSAPMIASGSRVIVVVSDGPSPTPPPAFVNVPDVVGMKQGDALSALQGVGSSAQVFNDYSDTVKRGMVMGQLPPAGVGLPRGTGALPPVSSGPGFSQPAERHVPRGGGKAPTRPPPTASVCRPHLGSLMSLIRVSSSSDSASTAVSTARSCASSARDG